MLWEAPPGLDAGIGSRDAREALHEAINISQALKVQARHDHATEEILVGTDRADGGGVVRRIFIYMPAESGMAPGQDPSVIRSVYSVMKMASWGRKDNKAER